jgi:hypothetical protein
VTAHQAGDAAWDPAPDTTRTFTIRAIGSGAFQVKPEVATAHLGDQVTVVVVTVGEHSISGAQAPVDFDPTRLQLVSIAKGSDWRDAGAAWFGYPGPAAVADLVAAANASGRLRGIMGGGGVSSYGGIAAAFIDGASEFPAGTPAELLALTFQAVGCGPSEIQVPVSLRSDVGYLIAGGPRPGYGYPLVPTSEAATVSIACPSADPSATASASPSPSADPSATASASPSPSADPSATASASPSPTVGDLEGLTPPPTDSHVARGAVDTTIWPLLSLPGMAVVLVLALTLGRPARRRQPRVPRTQR